MAQKTDEILRRKAAHAGSGWVRRIDPKTGQVIEVLPPQPPVGNGQAKPRMKKQWILWKKGPRP